MAVGALLGACSEQVPPADTVLRGPTMGTTYTVKVVKNPPSLDREKLSSDITGMLDDINAKMSTYDESSELSRFNRADNTEWVTASSELVTVVADAHAVSELTRGAFDVTVGPLVELWGFGPTFTADSIPESAAIEHARARVGFRRIETRTDPPAIRKTHADAAIDLSAIAKGYAVDRLAQHLESLGVRDFLVEIGGEIRTGGVNTRGAPWRIAVERPVATARTVYDGVELRNAAIATSGDYRNFFEHDGTRYSHTIDPNTGQPVTHSLASVTVLHPSAMRADALATALLVLGPEAGYRLAERHHVAALFITRDGDDFADKATPLFEQYRTRNQVTP
ncbi:MAG: FAD:protein FMN transferase [Pseudomonadota bacterium]|nr:MAG: FAD:protein FMN transferase [Pseudomonadota bacterium]